MIFWINYCLPFSSESSLHGAVEPKIRNKD
jgi:hypothetical protein